MKTEKVIGWVIYDAKTGEIVMLCDNRRQARKFAGKDGKIGKIVESH